jgi:hypothetical protein
MPTGAVKHDASTCDSIDKQPIRIDVALEEASVFASEAVLSERIGQRRSSLKQLKHVFERLIVQSIGRHSFLQAAEIAFEAPREDDLLHRRFKCAIASLAVVKRRTLPS